MIWIVGNRGMLGSDLEKKFDSKSLLLTDREVDITDLNFLKTFVKDKDIKWIINCAAYTAVDNAEDEEELAYKINSIGPENLAEIAKSKGAKLIHISTDYVFNGNDSSPKKEDDEVDPVSVYGVTKLDGEVKIESVFSDYFIIRTAWLYGPEGKNFVYTMLKLMNNNDSITVVNDQHGSPTYTGDLCDLIHLIIERNSADYGIYHFSNEGETTWFQFAEKIYSLGTDSGLIKSSCEIKPVSSDQFKTKAKRPAYSFLSKEKVKNTYNFNVKNWEDSLKVYFNIITSNVEEYSNMWK